MFRLTSTLVAALSFTMATGADACSCVLYQSQAEVDRVGETVWKDAALIVEATVGDVSAQYKALCPASGSPPRAGDVGRKASGDRPIIVHRVFKGAVPRNAALAGAQAEVFAQGCAVMTNSCDVGIQSNARTILVLNRVKSGRYEMTPYCSLMALRASKRGQALFARK